MKRIILIAAILVTAAASLGGQTVRHTMQHNGLEREYWLYVPDTLCAMRPLVFVCHGYGGKADGYFPAMIDCARKHGFVVCYPQGLKDPGKGKTGWNVGYPSQKGWEVDDVDFILALQEKLQQEYGLNPANTCFSGMSNGGEMCYLMAYTHPERFAAIVSLAGLTMEWIYRDIKPRGPVPFIEIHGTADKTSHWEGDPDNHDGWGEYIAVPHAVGRMISVNCCTHEVCDTLPLYKPGSHTVVCHRYLDGTDGAEVRLYEIIDGVHKNGSADMNVPEVLWEFFKSYMKPTITHLCTIDKRYPNDGDCYGDLFFQFHSQNQEPDGDFHGVSVADLGTGNTLAFKYLGFNQNFHNSSITFVDRKARASDKFPLLYASENYANNGYYKINVYRVRQKGSDFSFDTVQTIEMPSPDSLGILFPHAVPDRDGKHLWIEGYSADKKRTVFLQFDLPPFKNGSTVSMGAPLRRFEIKKKKLTDQAYCMKDGKFYQVVGVKREAWLRVIDIESGKLEREFLFNSLGLPHEPEAVFFWRDNLCVSFSVDGKAEVYKVDLP